MSTTRITVSDQTLLQKGYAPIFAPVGDSFDGDSTDRSLLVIKSKAAKVDLVADTNLSQAVNATATACFKYTEIVSKHDDLTAELQAEVDSFLGIDMNFLKNKAIPILSRFDFVKNAASKVLDVVKKFDPVVSGIQEVKNVLSSASGESFTEINPSVKKDHDEVIAALKTVEDKASTLETNLLQVSARGKELQKQLDSAPIDEDAFDWGGMFKKVVSVGGPILKQLL